MDFAYLSREITLGEVIKKLGETYNSIDIRTLAWKTRRRWHNIITVARLRNEMKRAVDNDLADIRRRFGKIVGLEVGVSLYTMAFKDWPRFVERVETGKMKLPGKTIFMDLKIGDLLSQGCSNSISTLRHYPTTEFPRISCFVNFDSAKKKDLPGQRFSGLYLERQELFRSVLGLEDSSRSYGLILELPIYARITNATVKGSKRAIFNLKTHRSLMSQLKMGILQTTNPNEYTEIVRRIKNVHISKLKRRTRGDFVKCQATYDIEEHKLVRNDMVEARLASDFGSICTRSIGLREHLPLTMPTTDEIPTQLKALTSLEGWNRIEEMLGLITPGSTIDRSLDDAFLLGISWLLEALGFHTYQFEMKKQRFTFGQITSPGEGGEKYLTGDVDILAYDPVEEVYYTVDCTMMAPETKKADLITNMAEVIESECGVRCRPMIAVCSNASNAKESIKFCGIIDSEDISAILDLVLDGKLNEARYEFEERILDFQRLPLSPLVR